MAAETLTAKQAASTVQARKHDLAGVMQTAFGYYAVAANVEDGDIFEMCKVPGGSLVVGGAFWTSDMDTGTETLDMDVGWADNGGASATRTVSDGTRYTNMCNPAGTTGAASPTGFVNSGVLTGDAITGLVASGNYRPFNMADGPIYFDKDTVIQVEANAAAATFAAGTMFVRVDYIVVG